MTYSNLHSESLLSIIRDTCKPMLPEPAHDQTKLTTLNNIRAVVFNLNSTLFLSGVCDQAYQNEGERDLAFKQVFELENIRITGTALNIESHFNRIFERAQATSNTHSGLTEFDIVEVWQQMFVDLSTHGFIEKMPSRQQIERACLRYECIVHPVWPSSGAEQILWKLHREGLALGILANSRFLAPLFFERFFEQNMEDYGIEENACIWSCAPGASTPHPQAYQKSAQWFKDTLQIAPSQILYVGSTLLNDLNHAAEAGFHTALYAGDKRTLPKTDPHSSEYTITPEIVIADWTLLAPCLR